MLYQIIELILSIACVPTLMAQLFKRKIQIDLIVVQCVAVTAVQLIGLFSVHPGHKVTLMIAILAILSLCLSLLMKVKISEVLYNEIILFFVFSFASFFSVVLAYSIETIIWGGRNNKFETILVLLCYGVNLVIIIKAYIVNELKVTTQICHKILAIIATIIYAIYTLSRFVVGISVESVPWQSKVLILICLLCVSLIILIMLLNKKIGNIIKKHQADRKQMLSELHKNKEVLPAIQRYIEAQKNGSELSSEFVQEIDRLMQEERAATRKVLVENSLLPSTGLVVLDSLFEQFLDEAQEKNILFEICCNNFPKAKARFLIDNDLITERALLQIVKDIVRNAMNAIECSDNENGHIFITMGLNYENAYELEFYDTGAEIPLNIIAKFGERYNTVTGTGNGIADILEALSYSNASFYVKEYSIEADDFSKSFSICFDGKGRRQIRTNRKVEIERYLQATGSKPLFEIISESSESDV